jgi:selenocysteine lyase/cysteine desulfurase
MKAFEELEKGVYAALETYSNVHRGSGHNSMVSTHLYEQARRIVLEYLGLSKGKYVVIFCTPSRADLLKGQLKPGSYQIVSSQETGLSLGIRVLAVKKKALLNVSVFQTGGGSARLVSPGWVVWAGAPERFEAGTPAIVNIIAFARALQMIRNSGNEIFNNKSADKISVREILYHDDLDEYSGRELLNELRKNLIGKGVNVPTVEGDKPFINLDNGASTPTFTPVWNTVCQTWSQTLEVQQEIINEVRSICAEFLVAPPAFYDIVFASNTTEAINLTARSLSKESEEGIEPVILNTILEHNSNDLPWRMVQGFSLIRFPVDAEGFVNLSNLETLLYEYNKEGRHGKKRIKLMAISGASNVLGVFNDLAEISRIVHRYGAKLFVDAAQLVAHRKISVEEYGIDYIVFSAHKVYAPFGSGVLVARKGLLHFDSSEMDLINKSGEENAVGIAALGKALLLLRRINLDIILDEEQLLTARTLRGMAEIHGLIVYGIKDPDSPGFERKGGVIVFSMKNLLPNRIAKELAERGGIGVRYGCHCAHIIIKHILNVPPGLEKFQRVMLTLLPGVSLPGLVRVSFGIENDTEDIDTLILELNKINRQPRLPKTDIGQRIKDFILATAGRVYF